ncbi:MAG: hypothetical protein ACOYNL_07095 [Rickettsiales bacterium]
MTRQMTNPDAIRSILEAMQQFGAKPHDANARRPAHAPDARHDAVWDLAKRLHAVEQQLRKLSARMDAAEKPARTGKRATAKPVAATKRTMVKRKPVAKSKPTRNKKPKK